MGLGVGIRCEVCEQQLTYDKDSKELVHFTTVEEGDKLHIKLRPVLCHACHMIVRKYLTLMQYSTNF